MRPELIFVRASGICLILSMLFGGCASFPSNCPTNSPGIQKFEQKGISFEYPRACFDTVKLNVLPKKVEVKDDFPDGVGPKRWVLVFGHAPRTSMVLDKPRYFQPSYSQIYITPIHDHSVSDFDKSYIQLSRNVNAFRTIFDGQRKDFSPWLVQWLRKVPAGLPSDLPDEPWNDAGEALCAKFHVLECSRIYGFRLLTYYVQGNTGYGATNAELLYNFQGITKDGKYYISARLAVQNPRLPDSIDDPRAASEGTEKEVVEEQKRVNSWEDDTFFPKLNDLDRMIESIIVKR